MLQFFVRDFNFLLIGDLIQDKRGSNFAQRTLALSGAQTLEVHTLHVFGAHALGSQCPQTAFQAQIDLLVDHGIGNREVIPLE